MASTPEIDSERVIELIDVLCLRLDVLEAVTDEQPLPKRTLVERLDVSRSTVDRGLRRLVGLGLLEQTPDGYTTTTSGRLLYTEFEGFADRVATAIRAQDLINHLPDTAPLAFEFLTDAELVMASSSAPYLPGERVIDLIEGADALTGLAKTSATPRSSDLIGEEIERGMTADFVIERELYEHVFDEYDWVWEYVETERYTVHVHDDVPYGLFVVEDDGEGVAALMVYDANNKFAGVLVADTDPAVAWARDVVAQYRREATLAPQN